MTTFHRTVADFKRRLLSHHLAGTAGNISEAARRLGLQRSYLSRLLKQHGIRNLRRDAR